MLFIKCNLCGEDDTILVFKKDEYNIVRCNNCGLLYTNPRDSELEIAKIYQRPYFELEKFAGRARIGYRDYLKDKEIHKLYFKKKLRQVRRHKKKGTLLDVGCATGYFLEKAKKAGFDAWGIDISSYAIKEARKIVGKNKAYVGTAKDISIKRKNFDVVTIYQTLEHSSDPLGDLLRIYKLLIPGGLLVITVPDQGSFFEKILKKSWFAYKPKEHLYYFDSKTIKKILKKAGFVKIMVRWDDTRPYPLYYILERLSYLYPKFKGLINSVEVISKRLKVLEINIPIFLGDLYIEAFKPGLRK